MDVMPLVSEEVYQLLCVLLPKRQMQHAFSISWQIWTALFLSISQTAPPEPQINCFEMLSYYCLPYSEDFLLSGTTVV